MGSLATETRWMDATDQAALVRRGDVSATELLEAAIERIESLDPALNAVVIRWFDEARDAAPHLPEGPFHGVPFLLKDLWAHYAGQPLTNGCQALKQTLPMSPTDTTLVSRFRQAGLNIAGRTNSPEFGSLPTTEPIAWGPTRNPWNLDALAGRLQRRIGRRGRRRAWCRSPTPATAADRSASRRRAAGSSA